MNILILNWRDPKNPKSGGAEIVTQEHAKAWVKAGHSVTWFTSRFPKSTKEEYLEGIKFVRRGTSISTYLFAPFFYLFSKMNYDVIIDEIHGIPYFTPLYVRKPKIAFIHEVAGDIWDYMYPFPVNIVGKVIENIFPQFYKNTTFWTDAKATIRDLVKKGIPRENCTAIPCPITNTVVTTLPKKNKEITILYVSRIVKMKGIEDVVQAFILIKNKKKDAKLWIVGTGEKSYVDHLKKYVRELGLTKDVFFWGFISNTKKLKLMSKAHILLHASVKEGWGLVVLEAASQGTPSIVYDVGSLKEVVKDNKTGRVMGENTPKSLADASLQLLDNKKKYRKFQNNGIDWVNSLNWVDETKKSLKLLGSKK